MEFKPWFLTGPDPDIWWPIALTNTNLRCLVLNLPWGTEGNPYEFDNSSLTPLRHPVIIVLFFDTRLGKYFDDPMKKKEKKQGCGS